MKKSDLKYFVSETGSNFFERGSMKFFGDTMKNYGVRSAIIEQGCQGLEVWELWRKSPVKHGLNKSTYFCKNTFNRVLV